MHNTVLKYITFKYYETNSNIAAFFSVFFPDE